MKLVLSHVRTAALKIENSAPVINFFPLLQTQNRSLPTPLHYTPLNLESRIHLPGGPADMAFENITHNKNCSTFGYVPRCTLIFVILLFLSEGQAGEAW